MKKLHIAIKTKTKVTQKLETLYDVSYYTEQTFFEKLLLKEKKYPDIYFHQGVLNNDALDLAEHSKTIIVNTNYIKDKILDKKSYIGADKIEVVYPYTVTSIEYDKQIKKDFRAKYEIKKNEVILFFTGKDLIASGLDKFLEIVTNLENKNFKAVILTDTTQSEKLRIKLEKSKILKKIIILEECNNIDELFIASDIFILPTKQKLFTPNMLKAMHYKNAVFINRDNSSSELIDAFSLIIGDGDHSVPFKVDALLGNNKELKTIQKENYLVVKNLNFDSYIESLVRIIDN